MKIIKNIREMQAFADSWRAEGRTISFVPTMGFLHEGHLNLMREGRKLGDLLVISIYVNPAQFAPNEDFDSYPRDLERDEKLAESVGVDVVFYPSSAEMYPEGYQTYVAVEKVTDNLCGLSRPGFFRGVATVCTKLFNIVKPHTAVFGQKDFQQLVTIRRMVADLNMDLKVVGIPTTRESDGLAMSSRNTYLSMEERDSARSLSRSLIMAKDMYDSGERDALKIVEEVKEYIQGHSHTSIDYVNICSTKTMADVERIEEESLIAMAVYVGKTRLIDNYVFGESLNIRQR